MLAEGRQKVSKRRSPWLYKIKMALVPVPQNHGELSSLYFCNLILILLVRQYQYICDYIDLSDTSPVSNGVVHRQFFVTSADVATNQGKRLTKVSCKLRKSNHNVESGDTIAEYHDLRQ